MVLPHTTFFQKKKIVISRMLSTRNKSFSPAQAVQNKLYLVVYIFHVSGPSNWLLIDYNWNQSSTEPPKGKWKIRERERERLNILRGGIKQDKRRGKKEKKRRLWTQLQKEREGPN